VKKGALKHDRLQTPLGGSPRYADLQVRPVWRVHEDYQMTLTYNARLMLMDHSKGTSNAMIKEAMKAEIMELRKALRAAEIIKASALNAQHRVLLRQIKKAERQRDDAKARADEWRGHAKRYQKLAATKRSKEA
jgi:hypothetical protein